MNKDRSRAALRFRIFLILLLSLAEPRLVQAAPAAGTRGMVTTAHPLATKAGIDILRTGGNAADAAAAAAFVLAVVEPYSSGIGGGGFALLRFQSVLDFLDFREVAPAKAHRDMYLDHSGTPIPHASRDGILSVAVPGAAAGYLILQERYGRLSRQDVLKSAIDIARRGFPANERYRRSATRRLDLLRQDPEASRIFLLPNPTGRRASVPPLGHLIVQNDLATTLEALALEGSDSFYRGTTAKKLIADMQRRKGLINASDLERYRVRQRKPLLGSYRGHAIASSPPPSSGGQILLTVLNLMETLPVNPAWRSLETTHLYIEACKRAFADRILLGDPDHVPYVHKLVLGLIAKDRAIVLRQIIDTRATPAHEIPPAQGAALPYGVPHRTAPPVSATESPHTSHLSVIDAEGNVVSLTTTVNFGWGSGIVAKDTGVLWNNEMDDFAIAPGVPNAYEIIGTQANSIAPGKVPMSSMSPTIVFQGLSFDSLPLLVVGSPGGSRIPTTVVQAIMNAIDHGADIERALSLGRIHHQHLPDKTRYEKFSLEQATLEALRARGHILEEQRFWSNATAIAIDPKTGLRTSAADPRGVGTAMAE